MTTLDDSIRNLVTAFIGHSPMSGREFGLRVFRDPGFVSSLQKGRSLKLDTADRLLQFMGEPTIGDTFRREVAVFITVTGTRGYLFGTEAAGDPSFVTKLNAGSSPMLYTVQRVRAWMRDNASDEERAAIAEAMGDDSEPNPLLDPEPATGSGGDRSRGKKSSESNLKPFLSGRQAAAFLNLSPRTLDRYRLSGDGPAYHKLGNRIMYARADLLAWAWARRHGASLEVL